MGSNLEGKQTFGRVQSGDSLLQYAKRRLRLFLFVLAALIVSMSMLLPIVPVKAATAFQLPMRGHVNVVGYVNNATSGIGDHTGPDAYAVDLTSDNATVYPVAPGAVVFAGYNCSTKSASATDCYGNVIAINHGGGYYSIYAHLACDATFNALVNTYSNKHQSVSVTTDTPIGTMSNTGINRSTCANPTTGDVHLHFAVRSDHDPNLRGTNALYKGIATNIWEYPSAGGSTWMPGLPWPQSTSTYNTWSLTLNASNPQPFAGDTITLFAQASSNAPSSLPPFQIVITDQTTGVVVQTCASGGTCSAQVTQPTSTTQTYTASIQYPEPFSLPTVVDMADATLSVAWQQPPSSLWTNYRYDAAQSGSVPNETILSPSTAPNLTLKWTYSNGSRIHPCAIQNGTIYTCNGTTVTAVDEATGTAKWVYLPTSGGVGGACLANNTIYAPDGASLDAIDATTGLLKWSANIGGSTIDANAADGLVFVSNGDGRMTAVDATSGTIVWNYQAGGAPTSPAIANGKVYFGSKDFNIYAVDEFTGALDWNYTTGFELFISSPAVVNGVLYEGSRDQHMYALDANTGALIWRFAVPLPGPNDIFSSPAVANGRVYFGAQNGGIYALDATSGFLIWSYNVGNFFVEAPAVVANGVVYIGAHDHNMYAFDANSGQLLWHFTTGDAVAWSGFIDNGSLYFSSIDTNLYKFSLP